MKRLRIQIGGIIILLFFPPSVALFRWHRIGIIKNEDENEKRSKMIDRATLTGVSLANGIYSHL